MIRSSRTTTGRSGEGTTSSSDGLRFGVAASALNVRHLPHIFGRRRGLTVYSHLSDQGTQFWVDVVNYQLREAAFVLDGLLYQDAPPIQEHYTDTHGYTDHEPRQKLVGMVHVGPRG